MAFIPIERHRGPLSVAAPHHMHQFHSGPSSVFTNDIISQYPFGSVTGHQANPSYNSNNGSAGPVVRNIKIHIEGEESETESETDSEVKVQVSRIVNNESENKEQNIEKQISESSKISSNETLLDSPQPTLGQGRKAMLLDLWAMNKISLQIRNWLQKSDFDVTTIVGNYQKGVSCGYIAAQAACIFRKLFTKDLEDEPLRPLLLSKCLDPELIKSANDVLGIEGPESLSLDMIQIYEVILYLMGGKDDLGWLTVTTWNAFLEGMTEGHSSNDFSVWIINTADTESSLREDYDDRGDHWFTVVIWP